jgi:hypothetical protein
VPAVVLGGAFAVLRLRGAARGALMLILGSLAIVAGVADGLRPALLARLSGDDLSAILAAVAGAVLVGAGAVTVWRSRRLDERRGRRYLRRALVGVVALVVAAELVYPLGMSFVATHIARAPVPAADLGRPYQRVAFTTADGLRLRGWYVPSRNGAAVIVFPGRRPNPVRHARMLARHGYGVLLFDRRGEGQSEGDGNLLGWGGDGGPAGGDRIPRPPARRQGHRRARAVRGRRAHAPDRRGDAEAARGGHGGRRAAQRARAAARPRVALAARRRRRVLERDDRRDHRSRR